MLLASTEAQKLYKLPGRVSTPLCRAFLKTCRDALPNG